MRRYVYQGKEKDSWNFAQGGGVALICILIAGCSQHDFTPIWRLCGVTITDSKDNTAVLYEGCEPSVFDIDLDTGESYSLDILRTDDNTSAAGFDISFICNGEELLSSQASAGFYVSKDGDTYTFNHIPSTEQSVDVIVSRDGAVIGILSINIRKDEAPEPPEAPVTITLSFDTTIENPEYVTIEAEEEISNLEIYYTLDGTDPTRASRKYEGSIDLSDAEGDEILRAKGFSGQSESDVIELDYLIKARTYIVYSEEGLSIWAMQGGNCILGKDIALVSNWTPVELYGKFDGRDHLIANLVIDYPDVDDVGFISCCYGSVHDLHLSGPVLHRAAPPGLYDLHLPDAGGAHQHDHLGHGRTDQRQVEAAGAHLPGGGGHHRHCHLPAVFPGAQPGAAPRALDLIPPLPRQAALERKRK